MIPTGKEMQKMSDKEVMAWTKFVLGSSITLHEDIKRLADRLIPCRECLAKWHLNEKCKTHE